MRKGGLGHAVVGFEIDLLIFDAAPPPQFFRSVVDLHAAINRLLAEASIA
jgi:hypothetical protein